MTKTCEVCGWEGECDGLDCPERDGDGHKGYAKYGTLTEEQNPA